jgi:hypothetical protein
VPSHPPSLPAAAGGTKENWKALPILISITHQVHIVVATDSVGLKKIVITISIPDASRL